MGLINAAIACLGVGAVVAVVSERRGLRHQATTDPLTGLLNRAEFERRARRLLHRAGHASEPAGLLVVDLDNFKAINDTAGHAAGDRVLAAAAARLAAAVRATDLVGRWGGDEFVVLLPGATARAIAERQAAITESITAVSVPAVGGTPRPRLSASVGAAAFPVDGDNLAALVGAADAAMYAAKSSGHRPDPGSSGHRPDPGPPGTARARAGGAARFPFATGIAPPRRLGW